ncbi:MAG: O-antigen ligase family protein [bacterium]|nr:O-antigen ligase family protein [bacterium]
MTGQSESAIETRLPGGWPRACLILLVLFAVSLETGIFAPQVFACLGGLMAIYCGLKRYLKPPGFQPVLIALGLALLAQTISAITSSWPLNSLSYVCRDYGMALTGFFVVIWLAREPRRLRFAFHALLIAAVLGGLYGLFQYFTGTDPLYGKTIRGPIREITRWDLYAPIGLLNTSLTYTGVQMTILLLALPVAWRARGRRALLLWSGIAIIMFSIYAPLKRSPLLGLAVGISVFFMQLGRKSALRFILASIVAVVLLVAIAPGFRARIETTLQMKTQSETDRVYLWQAARDMGSDYPLLGIGPGNWPKVRDEYLPEHDYFSVSHAHSDPMHLWATTGLAGSLSALAVFLMLVLGSVRDLRRNRKPSFERDLHLGMLLSLLGFATASLFQCFLLDGENALTLGYILGLGLASRELHMVSLRQ